MAPDTDQSTFERLERDHGVHHHLAHNMTATPANVDEVPEVVQLCRDLGYLMCSLRPAAEAGDERWWQCGYRRLDDDRVRGARSGL